MYLGFTPNTCGLTGTIGEISTCVFCNVLIISYRFLLSKHFFAVYPGFMLFPLPFPGTERQPLPLSAVLLQR